MNVHESSPLLPEGSVPLPLLVETSYHEEDSSTYAETLSDFDEDDEALGVQDHQTAEGIIQAVAATAETVLEEIQDAVHTDKDEEGGVTFVEMGITRNLSMLPNDVVQAAAQEHHHNHHQSATQPKSSKVHPKYTDKVCNKLEEGLNEKIADDDVSNHDKPKRIPMVAYAVLLIAVVSLSSVGALLKLQTNVSTTMKIVWRMGGTSMVLFPMAVYDVYRNKGFPALTTAHWITLLLSTICYAADLLTFVFALDYTSVGNTTLLSNGSSVMLMVGKILLGQSVTIFEVLGLVLAFCGAILCSRDAAAAAAVASNGSQDQLSGGGATGLGDSLALLSALSGITYLVFAKASRQHIPMYLFMFLTMFMGFLMTCLFQIMVLGEVVTLDRDVTTGLFGFLVWNQRDRLPLETVIVLVCNLCGAMGYICAMIWFDTLVIACAALLQPVVAEFIACAFGVGSLPGLDGWCGNFLVAVGTFGIIVSG